MLNPSLPLSRFFNYCFDSSDFKLSRHSFWSQKTFCVCFRNLNQPAVHRPYPRAESLPTQKFGGLVLNFFSPFFNCFKKKDTTKISTPEF